MINHEITTSGNNFTVPAIDAFLCYLKTLSEEESETILSNLQGNELGKMYNAMGKPAFMRKKKRDK